SENKERDKLLILLDEPGVFLHVNAQKELINLFHKLTQNGHQLLYTTHSPSMIDTDNISNIRVAEKIDNDTNIFNNSYNQVLSSSSEYETISPLLQAL